MPNMPIALPLVLALSFTNAAFAQSANSGANTQQAAPQAKSTDIPAPHTNNEATAQSAVTPPGFDAKFPNRCSKSSYPAISFRSTGISPTVVTFIIATDDSVKDLKISQSSGYEQLDQAVVECISGWHYKPATKDGQPIEVTHKASVGWQSGPPPTNP